MCLVVRCGRELVRTVRARPGGGRSVRGVRSGRCGCRCRGAPDRLPSPAGLAVGALLGCRMTVGQLDPGRVEDDSDGVAAVGAVFGEGLAGPVVGDEYAAAAAAEPVGLVGAL